MLVGVGIGMDDDGEGWEEGDRRTEMVKGEVCGEVRGGDEVVIQQSGGGGGGSSGVEMTT